MIYVSLSEIRSSVAQLMVSHMSSFLVQPAVNVDVGDKGYLHLAVPTYPLISFCWTVLEFDLANSHKSSTTVT
jgi:hypothetical protein